MREASGRRRTVRISDVAAAAGVSKTLVSYALNNRPGVRESTRAHIVATARAMGWTPSLPARALSVSRAYAIGLVFEKSPESLASDQTAIVYSNDLMAVAGMSACYARGLRVPDDISIVGWDDITVSRYLHPALSTVTRHPYDDGQVAATLLLEAIGGREFVEPVWMPNPRFVPR
jgi:DNA-binding LacI/PurR family transcriptional regulator